LHMHDDYYDYEESKLIQERFLEVLSPEGTILYRNKKLGSRTMDGPQFGAEALGVFSERSTRVSDGTPVILASQRHMLEGHPIVICLAYSEEPIWSRLKEFWMILLMALPLTLALAAAAGYGMANRALDPIRQMAQRAEQITTEHLHARLDVESNDELGHLARVFNQMLSRIEQSFEQLRRFTADASHELRTPLASIRSVGEVGLQKDARPEEYRDTIGSMLEEITRMTSLVDSLLALSRADAGLTLMKVEVFPIAAIVEEAASLLDVLIEEKGLKFDIETDKSALVRGDRLILRQAAVNVLHNAVKFTPPGGTISARVRSEGSLIILSVTDNGPGIPTEHLTKVFDRFYRVDPARAGENKGTGLGLSIAQWAARAHDGEIGLSPAPGGGCTFWIHLPLVPTPPSI
jgi:heavy metal sensor kinase